MTEANADPLLLTPGPLTTSPRVRAAMQRDLGSRDARFGAICAEVLTRLSALARKPDTHVCVPMQGSGTFAVEAMIGTFVPRSGRLLVLVNGAYGRRMCQIAERIGRSHEAMTWSETEPVDPSAVSDHLEHHPEITHVAVVHCETTTGLLNPLDAIASVVERQGRRLLIDAMSAFGAIDLPEQLPFDALAASSNKCLEGVPGLGFVVCDRAALRATEAQCHSLALDLHDQQRRLEATGQWRFTPPTHVILALHAALQALDDEGGLPARYARYRTNRDRLVAGMAARGYELLLRSELQAPIICTFRSPPGFDFQAFYDGLSTQGYVIYPGKLTEEETFRIGCIGQVFPGDIDGLLSAIDQL